MKLIDIQNFIEDFTELDKDLMCMLDQYIFI